MEDETPCGNCGRLTPTPALSYGWVCPMCAQVEEWRWWEQPGDAEEEDE